MLRRFLFFYVVFLCTHNLSPNLSFAQGPAFLNSKEGLKHVKAEIIANHNDILLSGESNFKIGVLFKIEPGWHIYWKNPGDAGQPTQVSWTLPMGWKVGETSWPYPVREIERGNITTFAYKEEVLLFSTLDPPPVVPDMDEDVKIEAMVSFLVCKDRCVPGRISLDKSFTVSSTKEESAPVSANLFSKYEKLVPTHSANGLSLHKDGPDIYLSFQSKVSAQFFEAEGLRFKTPELSENGQLLKLELFDSSDTTPIPGVLVYSDLKNTHALEVLDLYALPKTSIDKLSELKFNRSEFLLDDQESESIREQLAESTKDVQVSDLSLLFALLLSFLGGIILNVMPCVLPILALKIFSITKSLDKTKKENRADAFWFSVGVLFTFSVLAMTAILLRQTGTSLGWGFQFQYPGFVFGLILVLFVLSLGFFDLYIADLPILGKLVNYADNQVTHSRTKNIFDGILMTLLSTPCTAPFLGTALVYAFTRSPIEIFLVFIFIGLGLIAPYIILVNSPTLQKFFPKPGPWMQTVKEFLGIGLLGTIIWLLQVASKGGKLDVVDIVGMLLVVFVLFWGLARLTKRSSLIKLLFFLFCAFGAYSFWPLKGEVVENLTWQPYTKELVANTEGPVFIDFTAEWCITCKYNENFVLSDKRAVELFTSKHFTLVKADWTSGSDEISKALEEYGGAGVPHYVFISEKGGKVVVLPSILSVEVLRGVL